MKSRVLRHSTFLALFSGSLLLAGTARADVKSGREALLHGDYGKAETLLKAALPTEKPAAQIALGELYLETGRHAEAVARAQEAAQTPAVKGRALGLIGEAQRELGRSTEAMKSFQSALQVNPRDLRARVYLGMTYQEAGKKKEAEALLDQFFQEFNAGKIDQKRADHLTYTAMAARYLETWQDASDTFGRAVEKDPNFLLANLEWGDLFLQKYRADEAQKCFQEVLKINKNQPRALVGLARAAVDAAYAVADATKLADQALKANPRYVPALALKANLALDDERFAEAEALLQKALAVNPNDLQSLSLLAASRYLQDDLPGYEAQRKKALAQNPAYSPFYFIVAELVVRQHRYQDALGLYRQAVQLDPKDATSLAGMGLNLLRLGLSHEKEALQVLDRAFKLDDFDVRTYNTLNLYEEVISKEYETIPSGPYLFRFNKKESPVLRRYVPALMQRAWDLYVKKYGFVPNNPVTVELFTERQHYGARTTGLPEIGAQGTCFGELITAMSPSSAEASWELVLWHELAHVFHIQLTKNRAPRWFTEGLSEYETNIERPYWRREHAKEIFLSLQRGDLWKISDLSAAFTHPDRPNGVVIAYQQSSQVIHYLVETYGFPKIVQALKMYGEGKRDAEVLNTITGKPLESLDAEFREFLRRKYPHYANGFLFDAQAYADGEKRKKEAEAKPNDAAAQAAWAAALLARQPQAAVPQAKKALALDAKNALARFVLAQALQRAGDTKASKTEYEALLANATDGYAIRLALGAFAASDGDVDGAVRHLNEAKKWDPDRTEPYAALMQIYEAKNRRADLLKETEAYLDIEEHDHEASRLLIDRYAADKRWEDVVRVAPRVIGITPMEGFVHQQYGIALAALNRPKEAIPAIETALDAGVRKPSALRGLLAKQYLLAGDRARAKALAEQTLKEDPSNPDAAEVLKGG